MPPQETAFTGSLVSDSESIENGVAVAAAIAANPPGEAPENPHADAIASNGTSTKSTPNEQIPLPMPTPFFALPPDTTMNRARVVSDEVYDNIRRVLSRKTASSVTKDADIFSELRSGKDPSLAESINRIEVHSLPLYLPVAQSIFPGARIFQEQNGHKEAINSAPADGEDKSTAIIGDDEDIDVSAPTTTFDAWHQDILSKIRQGTSYHLLPIGDKLDLLEFLLDELICVGPDIVQELELRSSAGDTFWQTGSGGRPTGAAYGPQPDSAGLGDADNNNACAICNEEGDLFCCDGCILSYHKQCLSLEVALPQGKWLCPECEIADPSLLGPIRGGRKESLDWFTLSSLGMDLSRKIHRSARTLLSKIEFLVLHGFVFARDKISKGRVSIERIFSEDDTAQLAKACDIPSSAFHLLDFCREPQHPLPLTQGHLFKLLYFLGPDICAQWPWNQIPFDAQKVWSADELLPSSTLQDPTSAVRATDNHKVVSTESQLMLEGREERVEPALAGEAGDLCTVSGVGDRTRSAEERRIAANVTYTKLLAHGGAYRQYFRQNAQYNPLAYINQYRFIVAGARTDSGQDHVARHHHFDKDNFHRSSIQLYNALSRDFSHDDTFVQVLQKYPSLLDPLQTMKGYAVSLEQNFLRSSLLSPSWGAVKKTYSKEAWRKKVEGCRTVRGLARLVVELIDATNPRAFHEEWGMLPKGKGSDHTDPSEPRDVVFRMYFSLTDNWTVEKEIARRKWERSEVSDILSLLRSEPDGSTSLFLKHQEEDSGRSATAKKRKSTTPRAFRDDDDIEEPPELSDVTLSNLQTSGQVEVGNPVPFNGSEILSSTSQVDLYPPPKKNIPAYRHFCIATMEKLKASGDKRSFGAQNKYCSKLWKEISAEEKRKYEEIAAEDKARYQRDAAERDAAMRLALSPAVEENHASSQESTSQTEVAADAEIDDPLTSPPRTSSRGNRRRSDRVQRKKAVHKEIGSIVGSPFGGSRTAMEVKDIGRGNLLAKGEQQSLMNEAKEQKIAALEQLIQQPSEKDFMWPLAGRKLFDPEGSLPRSAAKCMGRVGGSRKIPNISYDEQFEVGRPSVSHIWRKKTLECNSLETLALQFQLLDSYLDMELIRSCEHLARRSSSVKHNAQKAVLCSHRDMETGRMEYFVIHRAKKRACWLDERAVDLPPLITWLSDRFEVQQMKASEVAKRALKEGEAEKAAIAAVQKAREKADSVVASASKPSTNAFERQGKKTKTEQSAGGVGVQNMQGEKEIPEQTALTSQSRSKLEVSKKPADSQNSQDVGIPKTVVTNPSLLVKESAPKIPESQPSLQQNEQNEKCYKKKKKSSKRSDASSQHQFSASEARNMLNAMPRSEGIENCKKFLKHITSSHRKDTYSLLRDASKKGKAMVPEDTLNSLRVRRMTEMKNINNELEKLGAPTYEQITLTQKLVEAEHGATKDFVKDTSQRNRSAGIGSTSSSKRKRQSGGKHRDSALPRNVVIKATSTPHHHAIGSNTAQAAPPPPGNAYSNIMSPEMSVDTTISNKTAPAGLGTGYGGVGNPYNSAMSPEMSVNTSSSMHTAPAAGAGIGIGLQPQLPAVPEGAIIGGGSQTTAPSVPPPDTMQGFSTAPSNTGEADSSLMLQDLRRLLNQQQSMLQGILTANTSSQPEPFSQGHSLQQTVSQPPSQLQQDQAAGVQYQQLSGGLFGIGVSQTASMLPLQQLWQQQQQQQQSQSVSNGDGGATEGFDTDAFMQRWGDAFEPTPMPPRK